MQLVNNLEPVPYEILAPGLKVIWRRKWKSKGATTPEQEVWDEKLIDCVVFKVNKTRVVVSIDGAYGYEILKPVRPEELFLKH